MWKKPGGFFCAVTRVQDPVFGEVLHKNGRWTGEVLFPPTGTLVNLAVPAGKEGPGADQRAFFTEVCEHYPQLLEAIRPMMLEQAQNWDEGFSAGDLWHFFRLKGLTMPAATLPRQWAMTFWCEAAGHAFETHFEAWESQGLSVHG